MTIEILFLICAPSIIAWFLGVAFADFLEWCQHVDWSFSVTIDISDCMIPTPVLVEEIPPTIGGQADAMAMDLALDFFMESDEPEVKPEPVATEGELTSHLVLDTFVFGGKSVSPVVSRIVSEHLPEDIMPKAEVAVAVMIDETPIEEISRQRGALYLEDVKFSGSRGPVVRPSVARKMVARQQSYIEAPMPMEAVQ